MKNIAVNIKGVTIENGDTPLFLELRPVTFARLSEMANAVPDRPVNDVLQDPTHLEICKLIFCLLTEKSKERLKNIKLKINGDDVESNLVLRFYYFAAETTVEQGHRNLLLLSDALNKQIIDSFPQEDKKKLSKTTVKICLLTRKSFMTLLPLSMVVIGMMSLLSL